MDERTIARFWSKVDRCGPVPEHLPKLGRCWLWTSFRERKGYGAFTSKTLSRRAHRAAWQLTRGPIPPGIHVLHLCDNPPCVNPDHLFLGSNAENMRDRDEKGRVRSCERNGMAKLSNDAVQQIRARYRRGNVPELATEFGVARSTIYYVLKLGWKRL